MTTSESKGRFFLQNESILLDSHNESNRIANWNALQDAHTLPKLAVLLSVLLFDMYVLIFTVTGKLFIFLPGARETLQSGAHGDFAHPANLI